jgi:lysophospholipase L1-like esterase
VKGGAKPGRGLLRNLCLSAASLLIFLVLAEAASQLALRGPKEPSAGVADAWVGFRLRSNHVFTEVGGARVRTNSRGFRGAEVSTERPPGGVRILAIGDSSTFGYGVRVEETYPAHLERSLSKRFPGRAVEVINAGTPGWASGSGAAFLAREGLAWKPDAVLISFGYNEQLGSGPGEPHYDYDSRLRRVWFHSPGEETRTLLKPQPEEEPPRSEGFFDRFRDFPSQLKFFLLIRHAAWRAHQGAFRLVGWFKSSDLTSWFLAKVYAKDPGRIHARLRVQIEGNHVVEAYVAHLEDMVKLCRGANVRVVIVLQPRRAYREFLDLLPGGARAANLRAIALLRQERPFEAIRILEPQHSARPKDAITIFNLSLAYRLAGRNAEADLTLDKVLHIRTFALNAVADQTAARLGVPVVYTPLSFLASNQKDLYFPDRYHTHSAGYALVAEALEEKLIRVEYLPRDLDG